MYLPCGHIMCHMSDFDFHMIRTGGGGGYDNIQYGGGEGTIPQAEPGNQPTFNRIK